MTASRRYGRRPDLLVRRAPGFVAVARTDGSSISLAGSGAAVWALLDVPRTVAEVATELGTRYDAEPGRIAVDVEPLLVELAESGYLTADG